MISEQVIAKMSLKEADIAWGKTDLEIERLYALEKMMQRHYNKLVGVKAKDATDGLIKGLQSAIADQLRYQSALEAYLIENEAPGWTST